MLTNEQILQFRKEGYLVFEALIQGERLAYYKQVFDELVAEGSKLKEQTPHWTLELDEGGEPRAGLLHKVQGVCVVDARVLELAREPAIVDRRGRSDWWRYRRVRHQVLPEAAQWRHVDRLAPGQFLLRDRHGSHCQLRDLPGRCRRGEWLSSAWCPAATG